MLKVSILPWHKKLVVFELTETIMNEPKQITEADIEDVKMVAEMIGDFVIEDAFDSDESYYSKLFKLYGYDEKLTEKQLVEVVCLKVVSLCYVAKRLIASLKLQECFCENIVVVVSLQLTQRYSDLSPLSSIRLLKGRKLLYAKVLPSGNTDVLDKESGATAVFITLFMPDVGSRAQQEELLRVGTLAVAILEHEQKSAEMMLQEVIKKEYQNI